MPIVYRKSPEWNMFLEGGRLFIARGADETYLVDDINDDVAKEIHEAYANDAIDSLDLQKEGIEKTLNQLQKAGVIYKGTDNVGQTKKPLRVFFKWYGGRSADIDDLLAESGHKTGRVEFVNDERSSDLMVLARFSGKMANLMEGYSDIEKPHLFLDIAYDHNISIGPLVFPGKTACLGCIVGRETKNWGDPVPPEFPAASKKYLIIASFVFEALEHFLRSGSCSELVEKVVTLNIDNFSTASDPVFRLPWCRACYPDGASIGDGRINIAWNI